MFQRVETLQNELSEASECKRSMQEQLSAVPSVGLFLFNNNLNKAV